MSHADTSGLMRPSGPCDISLRLCGDEAAFEALRCAKLVARWQDGVAVLATGETKHQTPIWQHIRRVQTCYDTPDQHLFRHGADLHLDRRDDLYFLHFEQDGCKSRIPLSNPGKFSKNLRRISGYFNAGEGGRPAGKQGQRKKSGNHVKHATPRIAEVSLDDLYPDLAQNIRISSRQYESNIVFGDVQLRIAAQYGRLEILAPQNLCQEQPFMSVLLSCSAGNPDTFYRFAKALCQECGLIFDGHSPEATGQAFIFGQTGKADTLARVSVLDRISPGRLPPGNLTSYGVAGHVLPGHVEACNIATSHTAAVNVKTSNMDTNPGEANAGESRDGEARDREPRDREPRDREPRDEEARDEEALHGSLRHITDGDIKADQRDTGRAGVFARAYLANPARNHMSGMVRIRPSRPDLSAQAGRLSIEDLIARSLISAQHQIEDGHKLLLTDNAPGIKKMRVGLRRLRALAQAFRPALRCPQLRHLTETARVMARHLGALRDLEVLAWETLPDIALRAGTAPQDSLRLETLADHARARYHAQWRALDASIRKGDFNDFLLSLSQYCALRKWREAMKPKQKTLIASTGIHAFSRQILDRRLEKARDVAKGLETAPIDATHPLRIELKKLRYNAQALRSLYGKETRTPYMQALSRLQAVFGSMNDAQVALILAGSFTDAPLDACHARGAKDTGLKDLEEARLFLDGWYACEMIDRTQIIRKEWAILEALPPFWQE